MSSDRLDRYLDGLLSPEEVAAFERKLDRDPHLRAELAAQSRVDAFLHASYSPPAGLHPPTAVPSGPSAISFDSGRGGPALLGPGRAVLLGAAAALLIGLGLGFALLGKSDGAELHEESQAQLAIAPDVDHADHAELADETSGTPDIAALYRRLTESDPTRLEPRDIKICNSPIAQGLAENLTRRYQECLDVESPTCALFGPYEAPEWPSATVMVGFCDGIDQAPSMLVVDNQTMEGCALLPRSDGLQPFYKEVNGLAVWEISPGDHPQLLNAVRSCQ